MSLTSGTRLGPYEISAQIGAGGMGEVYRARDTKLNREVALKVLPESFLHDADRLARFQREAHVLASLNHPNIAAIYGVEDAGGTTALVIELVEGPTLADRIASGPLPLDEAVPIAQQIADALEAAHEQGIVHRDLKPANVKVKSDGTVKVLDFGLAKAIQPAASRDKQDDSPTITTPAMTQVGMLLGTAAYMSPEQAKGRPADKRSDVWAFGCVLYEMLTGRRAFEEEDVSETLASVLRGDPDWTRLPSDVPQAIRTLIQRCLVKDRRQRVAETSAAKFVLHELSNLGGPPTLAAAAGASRTRWQRLIVPTAAAGIAAIIAGATAWGLRPHPRPRPPVVARFSMTLPEREVLSGTRQAVAISPDGTQIVYAANSGLYLRSIGELESHAIPGTANTAVLGLLNPMFAPDGQSVAYFTQGDGFDQMSAKYFLRHIPIGGGAASTIGTVDGMLSATWGSHGILIGQLGGILRVSPGGAMEQLMRVGPDERVHGPQMLPDGKTVLFTVGKGDTFFAGAWDRAQIVAQSLTDGSRKVLIDGGSDGRYLGSGHLVHAIGGTLFAAPLQLESLTLTRAAVPVLAGVRRVTGRASAATHFALSESGTLIYVPGPATASATATLVLADGRGDLTALKVPPGEYVHPRASPTGNMIAVVRNNGPESDVWTYNLSGTTEIRRLTFGGNNRFPVWSGDGRRVTFQSTREGDRAIFWQLADGTSPAERLMKPGQGEEHRPESWSRDGMHLLFSVFKGAKFSLWVLTLNGRAVEPFGGVESAEQFSASFSPDGRWVAYAATRIPGGVLSPNRGVFVQPFPATGEMHQVPKKFLDFHPAWMADGKGIVYIPGSTRPAVVVPITTRPALAFGTPEELPRGPQPGLLSSEVRGYDVLPDGRFLSLATMSSGGEASERRNEIRIVLNWLEELKREMPAQ